MKLFSIVMGVVITLCVTLSEIGKSMMTFDDPFMSEYWEED